MITHAVLQLLLAGLVGPHPFEPAANPVAALPVSSELRAESDSSALPLPVLLSCQNSTISLRAIAATLPVTSYQLTIKTAPEHSNTAATRRALTLSPITALYCAVLLLLH
jgi:hypothetical protein